MKRIPGRAANMSKHGCAASRRRLACFFFFLFFPIWFGFKKKKKKKNPHFAQSGLRKRTRHQFGSCEKSAPSTRLLAIAFDHVNHFFNWARECGPNAPLPM